MYFVNYIHAIEAKDFRNPLNEGRYSLISRCSSIGCVRAGSFALLCTFRSLCVQWSFFLSSKFSIKDIQCLFWLKTCVYISSLLLSKRPQKEMTWCGWKREGMGGEREGVCYIYDIIRERGSMILDGIWHGERESTKFYFI